MSTNASTIDELIKKQNPFAGHIVVRPPQIWGKSFPDVPSINAHASNAVFDAVEKIRNGERETVGITITAEKGLGKSQVVSRIRHRLQLESDSLFVYMSRYDNLNQIQHQFLQNIASSLRAFGSQKVMQWQEIAAALINEAKQWKYTPQQYISQYPNWLNQYSTKFLENLTELILQIKPEINNPYIVKAILWTLSPVHVNFASYWLSGLELAQTQADAMGLPNPKSENKADEVLNNARQILDIISYYKIPVICLDELDDGNVSDLGFTTAQVIASLVKNLYNSLNRGVFLLAMYPGTWNEQIRSLPQADAVIDRLASEQFGRKPIELNSLNSDDIVALVKRWLQDFYEEHQQKPPHPLYPFNENKLREFGKAKPTVRSVLKWCADNFGKTLPQNPVKPYFQSELVNVDADIDSLLENEAEIAKALRLCFESLIGDTVEGVKIEEIKEVEASLADYSYIDFKIIGNNNKVRIGVDVIQQSGGKYVGAALKRLIDYQTFDLTRGCLVRSKNINQGAALARERLKILLKEKGGEWVGLQKQDIKPLLAISFVYEKLEIYELKKEQIVDFIKEKKLAINNPLIREILSDPSGQEPTNLTADDLPMRIPQSAATADNIEMKL